MRAMSRRATDGAEGGQQPERRKRRNADAGGRHAAATVLSRASYHSEHEREAELLASLILAQAQRAIAVMPVRDLSAAEIQILRRAGLALGMEP
jgi:hypothetical protein